MYIPKEDRYQFMITMLIAFFMFCLLGRGVTYQDNETQKTIPHVTAEGIVR